MFPEVRDFKVVEDNASYEIEYIEPGDISSFFIDGDADCFEKTNFFRFLSDYFRNLKKCPPNKNFSKVLKQRLTKRSKEFVTFLSESDHPLSELVVDLFNENAKALDREFKGGLFSFLDENPTAAIHSDLCL